jgi:hypothetical protein
MTVDASELRPHGIRRKLAYSPSIAVETAGNYMAAHFPHGAKVLGIYFVPSVAVGTAPSIIDVGTTSAGVDIVENYSLTHTASVAGTGVQVTGLISSVLPKGTTLWINTDGASTGGTGIFVIEYEDQND